MRMWRGGGGEGGGEGKKNNNVPNSTDIPTCAYLIVNHESLILGTKIRNNNYLHNV